MAQQKGNFPKPAQKQRFSGWVQWWLRTWQIYKQERLRWKQDPLLTALLHKQGLGSFSERIQWWLRMWQQQRRWLREQEQQMLTPLERHEQERRRELWRRFSDWLFSPVVMALLLGVLGVLIGYGGYLYHHCGCRYWPNFVAGWEQEFEALYANFATTLIGIAIAVFTIDRANERRAERQQIERQKFAEQQAKQQLKAQLIREMGNPDNGIALRAVRELRAQEWIEDGSLQEADLQGANLQRADLRGANLNKANLQGANLEGANLERAYLEEAKLEGASLQGAYLQRASLQKANLQRVNLQGANLPSANLQGAYLYETNLHDSNLQGASLKGVDMQETDLEEAFLYGAVMPDGSVCVIPIEGTATITETPPLGSNLSTR